MIRFRSSSPLMLFVAMLVAHVCIARASEAQETNRVTVENDLVEISLVQPKLRIRQPRALQFGYYSWRIDFKTRDGSAIVLAADSAMRTDNLRDIVRGSSLRRCSDAHDFSSLRCTVPLSDSATVRNDVVRIALRDSSLVHLMRSERPAQIWVSVFEPNGRFRVDQLRVAFDDDVDPIKR